MFLRRRILQLNSRVNNIAEETELTIKLLDVLNKHSAHLMSTIINVSSPESFSEYYCQVNSSLYKYRELLTRINCDLEMTILAETNKWKIKNEINPPSNPDSLAICESADKDKIITEHLCHYMNISSSRNSEESAINDSCNFLKNKSELKLHHNTNVITHPSFQSVNDYETIHNYDEHGSNLIMKSESAKTQEQIFSTLSNISNFQWLPNDIGLKFSNVENFTKAKHVETDDTNCELAKITTINFSEKDMLDHKNVNDMEILKSPNTEYSCIMGNVISLAEFYVHIINDQSLLLLKCDKELKLLSQDFKVSDNLMNLKDYLYLLKANKVLKHSRSYALFYSKTDDTFHRVKIKNETFDEVSDVDIILIDYGVTISNVCLDKLYLMPDHFYIYPAFATKCYLTCKTSTKSITNLNFLHLNAKLLEMFKNWITVNQKVIAVIDEDENNQLPDSLPVKIYNLEKNECFNHILENFVEKNKTDNLDGKADYDLPEVKNDNQLEEWNPMKEDFNSNMNLYGIDIEDPAIAIYGYIGKDHQRICSLYSKKGVCFKGASCRKEHVRMDRGGFTKDKEEIFKNAFKSLKMPRPNDELYVTVTYVAGPTEFYCVAHKLHSNYEEESLFSLVHYMNLGYNISKMKQLLVPPSIGQIVIGKFRGDGFWYRAKVIDVAPEKDEYCLYFVDYGNTETVSFSNIRAIEVQYLHLPFQALCCAIQGVKISLPLPNSSVKYLQSIVTEIVKIKVLSVTPGDNYRLIVKAFNKNGDDIVNDLIKKEIFARIDDDDEIILPVSADIIPG